MYRCLFLTELPVAAFAAVFVGLTAKLLPPEAQCGNHGACLAKYALLPLGWFIRVKIEMVVSSCHARATVCLVYFCQFDFCCGLARSKP